MTKLNWDKANKSRNYQPIIKHRPRPIYNQDIRKDISNLLKQKLKPNDEKWLRILDGFEYRYSTKQIKIFNAIKRKYSP